MHLHRCCWRQACFCPLFEPSSTCSCWSLKYLLTDLNDHRRQRALEHSKDDQLGRARRRQHVVTLPRVRTRTRWEVGEAQGLMVAGVGEEHRLMGSMMLEIVSQYVQLRHVDTCHTRRRCGDSDWGRYDLTDWTRWRRCGDLCRFSSSVLGLKETVMIESSLVQMK